ncbi:MAG: ribonuclease P protein component [Planctomycetota bacterium]
MTDASPTPAPAPTQSGARFHRWMRLVRGSDFARVYKQGSRARGDLVTIAVLPNGGPTTRLGLSVGRKCWKSAVRRNRVRRVFREAFRLEYAKLPAGHDIVVIGSVPQVEPELSAARRELVRLARKAATRAAERRGERP